MLPVNEKELKRVIDAGRKAGKDMSGLERELAEGFKPPKNMSHCRRAGDISIISTGPARKSDFHGLD